MIDVDPRDRKTLEALITRFLPGVEVWAFGSRTTGKARPSSDLDIALFATPALRAAVSELREALDESDLPFRVDVLDWETLPANFRRNISAAHEVFIRVVRG